MESLYMLPDHEIAWVSIATLWESEIEPWLDRHYRPGHTWRVEEYSTLDPIEHIHTADMIADWISESAADDQGLNESGDAWHEAVNDPGVLAHIEELRTLIASRVGYRQCDLLVATHVLTLDENLEPLLNNEPLYVKSE